MVVDIQLQFSFENMQFFLDTYFGNLINSII